MLCYQHIEGKPCSIVFGVFLAVILALSAPVSVAAQEITSNFDHFFALPIEEENSLGISTPPDSAVQVAEHRGVPILETESRPFSEDEIAEIPLGNYAK